MADPRYEIPGPVVPDLSPALALLGKSFQEQRANRRADEYMQMERDAIKARAERESAAVAREKAETDRKHAIEAYTAMPALQRAALKSVPQANTNPYGVHFDETMEPPDQGKADAAVGGFLANDQPPEQAPEAPRQLLPTEEGPEQAPAAEAARFASPDDLMSKATGAAPLDMLSQAAASSFGPPVRHVQGSYGGQKFDVQPQSDKTPFGPQYDSIYQGLLETGEDPHKALQYVAAQYKADQTQEHIASRTADQIAARQGMQGQRLDFQRGENEKYRETHQGRMELVDEAGKFKVAASAPGLKADAANARDMSLLERAGSAIRQTGQFSKLAASDKTVRGLMTNIANGTTPLQHKDAQIQLARFFRQAQPTEGEMHLLYNNLGGTMDKWNQFVARLSTGDLSGEQMRQLKASAGSVAREHNEDVRRFVGVMKARLGPGGGFDLMPDQAQKLYESMGAELGLENLPPLYGVEGGVTLGSGKRPTVQPRGTKKTELDGIEEYLDRLGGHGGR